MTNFRIDTIDLPTFARHAIGFDRIFNEMNRQFANTRSSDNYPPYKYKQLEEDLIKYICEKIVAMREQPFIDAVDNLRRAQELNNL